MYDSKRAQCTLTSCDPGHHTAVYTNTNNPKNWTLVNVQCRLQDVGKSRSCYTFNKGNTMVLGFPRDIGIAIAIMAPGWVIFTILMTLCIYACIDNKLNDLDALEAGNANTTAPTTPQAPLNHNYDNLCPLDDTTPGSGGQQTSTGTTAAVVPTIVYTRVVRTPTMTDGVFLE